MRFCDLHMHSTASDGTDAPEALAALARAAGLSTIALTDHDTTAGLPACAAACEREGIEFVPGIEVSADPRIGGAGDVLTADTATGTLHILGLFVEHDHPAMLDIHERLLGARLERNPRIVRNLQDLGVRIEYGDVLELAEGLGTRVIGRPHIAMVLVKKGYVKSVQDAFARYLGEGKPAFARADRLPPAEAIAAIHDAGGLAVLAHPVQLKCADADALDHLVVKLRDLGLDGIETRHSDHTASLVERYEKLAQKLGLLVSGGSDYHGNRKSVSLGGQRVPVEVASRLREAREARRV